MPRYGVRLYQTVLEEAYIEIEADDEDAAKQAALERANTGVPTAIEWEFLEAVGDVEADVDPEVVKVTKQG